MAMCVFIEDVGCGTFNYMYHNSDRSFVIDHELLKKHDVSVTLQQRIHLLKFLEVLDSTQPLSRGMSELFDYLIEWLCVNNVTFNLLDRMYIWFH